VSHRSLTFRLVAWYCGLLLVIGGSFAIYTYAGFTYYLRNTVRSTLATRANDVATLSEPLLDDPSGLRVAMEKRFAPEMHDRFMRITVDGRTAYISGPPTEHAFDPAAIDARSSMSPGLRHVGILWIYSSTKRLPDGRTLAVETGALGESMATASRGLVYTLGLALPVLLIIAAMGGYWLVGHALTPVAKMISAAEALTFNSPRKRLPLAGTDDVLDELGRTLNRMLERLDNAYQHANRFSADAAHELRTPLAIMRGELEFIAPRHDLAPEVYTAAGSALDEAIRMGQIVENLLALAVIEGGGGKRAHWAVDIRALAVETIEQMRLLADEKKIALLCTQGLPVLALGDRERLKQALVNLIDNAIKYTGEGGSVTVDVLAQGEHALLKVIDTGIGITAEHQASVFDRFFRVDPDRGPHGAGLGLAIIKSICAAHSGSISVQSEPNRGSTFSIELPLAPANSPTNPKTK
jgi:signal transduction histidine kinase